MTLTRAEHSALALYWVKRAKDEMARLIRGNNEGSPADSLARTAEYIENARRFETRSRT